MIAEKPEDKIIITPLINAKEQFGPSSIDLRLGTGFKVVKNTRYTHIDPLNEPEQIKRDIAMYTEDVQIRALKPFILHPGEFALGSTLEFIRLPDDIAARLEGRSTWGRVGLQIHSTAGFVDPGFSGSLTFELQNMGKVPLSLYAGMRLAQISFYQSEKSFIPYNKKQFSKYGGKMGTVGSLYSDDQEFKIFRELRKLENKT
jgi:dCTP deaminase